MDDSIKRVFLNPGLIFLTLGHRGLLNWISDENYLKIAYRIRMGKKLNLESPATFNEKIQWIKLNDRKPIYTNMVDKIEAKKIVSSIIGEEYVIPTIGVWERFQDIDFNGLPSQFVLKCSHDSGGLVICRDKAQLDICQAKRKIEKSLKHNFYYSGREWPYKNVRPRILAEYYMENNDSSIKGLVDYKFFCFNGTPQLLYVSHGLEHHPTAEISFYDMKGNEMPFHRSDFKPFHGASIPDDFDEMKIIAKRLSQAVGCPFVRIDLYSINGKIYFSEITFSPCSGMIPFEPKSADLRLGKLIKLPNEGC